MNADSDKKQQDFIELKNKAESLAYQTEKTMREAGDKVDEAARQSATEKIEVLRKALTGENEAEIQAAFNALETESHAIAAKLYEAQSGSAGPAPDAEGPSGGANEEVIDAEFKEAK